MLGASWCVLSLPKHRFSVLPEFFSCARLGCGVGDLIDCYPMVGGEEGVKLAATGCEGKRVRALFGRDASELLHRLRVEDVDGARAAYGDIKAFAHAIEEHDIDRRRDRWDARQRRPLTPPDRDREEISRSCSRPGWKQ